ncbi:MAG: hypothetical protein H8E44_33825 [Planctomycetes bacterium]|nr:hypothetical protein [Planctomycetota bacterium]MBL7037110.1 hypothetical protein [Pirellulaceae bacterium]
MRVAFDAAAFDRRHSILAATIACCLFLVANDWSSGADGGPAFQRFAIVATGDIQGTGLSDLVTAKLSAVAGVELVEREQLAAAIKEQELSACFNSTAAPQRLKLGQLLEADVLILLSTKAPDTVVGSGTAKRPPGPRPAGARSINKAGTGGSRNRSLRLVICDCLYGARLHVEYIPLDADAVDVLAAKCISSIEDTRRKFSSGVEHLIGVTHFLSKNLTHDYDHLQAGYAGLVENALSVYPGVAVLEIDEVRAISNELRLSGGRLKQRVVPLFVEGQFEVSMAASGSKPKVNLSIRVRDGKSVVGEAERTELSEDDAIRLLTEILPKNLIKLAGRGETVSLSRQRQRELLMARADAFSRVGHWEQSTALREAALLLQPDDAQQRLAVFSDYHHWHFARHRVHAEQEMQLFQSRGKGISPDELKAKWDPIYDERLSRFRLMALHASKLIHDRAVNPYEADWLTAIAYRDPRILGLSGEAGRPEFREALYSFFWDVYPQFPKLDPTAHEGNARLVVLASDPWKRTSPESARMRYSPETQFQTWTENAIVFLTRTAPYTVHAWERPRSANRSYGWDDRRTLDELYRFLTQVAPPDEPLWAMARLTLGRSIFHRYSLFDMMQEERLTPDDIQRFCKRLEEPNVPLNVLYARCGLFMLRFRASDADANQSTLAEADTLLEWIRQEQDRRDDPSYARLFVDKLRGLREDLLARQNAATKKRHRLMPNVIPPHVPTSRITFLPVPDVNPQWDHVIACGDSLDIMWSRQAVCAMSQPGEVRPVFQTPANDRIVRVVWDGRYVWVGTLKSGIFVITPDGKAVGQVGNEQGLPPYEEGVQKSGFVRFNFRHPLLLHPLAPGQCLALGRFGQHGRVWIAVIKGKNDGDGKATFRAEVIHTATKTEETSPNEIDKIFDLAWWAEYPDPSLKQHRQLLLGKMPPTGRPLAIDLQDYTVSIFNGQFRHGAHMHAVGHNLVSDYPYGVYLHRPPNDSNQGGWKSKVLIYRNEEKPGIEDTLVPSLLRCQGALYNPGPYWRRIDESDLSVEQLNTVPLPHRHRYRHYGVSAHYGIVAWTGDEIYHRVLIDDQPRDELDLAALYPEVPQERRQRHHSAVQTLRQLGASVDAMWGLPGWDPANPNWDIVTSNETPHPFTIVYLPKQWRGGDQELVHLNDLHNLRVAFLIQADVSDEGLKWIGELPDLQILQLVETSVTDAGLAQLRNLERLHYLRLEGTTSGREFTDAGLRSIAEMKLSRLALYGPGFTTQAATHLGQMTHLRTLLLYDTGIPDDALSELKNEKPGLAWQRRPCKNRCHHPECQKPK